MIYKGFSTATYEAVENISPWLVGDPKRQGGVFPGLPTHHSSENQRDRTRGLVCMGGARFHQPRLGGAPGVGSA